MTRWLCWGLLASLACVEAAPIKVLTYNSMTGKNSYGEWLAKAFKESCKDCEIEFVTNTGASSLLGKLRLDAGRKTKKIDAVLGLSQYEKNAALALSLIVPSQVSLFDYSPMILLLDSKKLPVSDLKISWPDLANRFSGKVLVQDPRMSALGVAWLSVAFDLKVIGIEKLQKLQARVYPSWSAAFGAFSQGEAPLIWTMQTSQAYNLCQGGEAASRFKVIETSEGVPVHREFVAAVSNDDRAKKFVAFATSLAAQKEIALRNWMIPAHSQVELPDCFKKMTQVKFQLGESQASQSDVDQWISAWSGL